VTDSADPDERAAGLVSAALGALSWQARFESDDERRARPEVQIILNAPDDLRRRCIMITADDDGLAADLLLPIIARKRAGLAERDVEALLPRLRRLLDAHQLPANADRLRVLAGQVEDTWAALDDDARGRLGKRLEWLVHVTGATPVGSRLRKLVISGTPSQVPYELIENASPVGKALRASLADSQAPDEAKAALVRLLSSFPASGKPGKKWLEDAAGLREMAPDPAALAGTLLDAALAAPDSERPRHGAGWYATDSNEAFLRGLAILAGLVAAADTGAGPDLLPRLRTLALKAIAIVGGSYGTPRSMKLASSCVKAMADAALPSSVTELLRTERGTRHGSLLKQVRQAIDAVAAARGIGRDELLERAVEDHDLSTDGTRVCRLPSGWTVVLEAGARTAQLCYLDPGGKPRKSLPTAVKQASADAVAGLSKDLKAVRVTVGNERARLDALLSADRVWPLADWRELYLDHPVTGRLTRALIWRFRSPGGGTETAGIPVDKAMLLASDGTQTPIPSGAQVRPWHPVHAAAQEVSAWRQLLLARELAQPVKQAFREVYVLTPAEEQTRDYSNRFSEHVFWQDQARAIMKGRGWVPVPLTARDYEDNPGVGRREYGRAGLRAEFSFDPASDDVQDSGLYTFCLSGQVRFFPLADGADGAAVPLAEVPPQVFSEAMRDVDLYIGAATIGADPEWLGRGEGRQFEEYWRRWGFGALNASAEVRREVLAQLVPRLAIADRCTLEDSHLVVRGDLRTYRIHLGSGNVLMPPNDQYLCVVSAHDAQAGKLFLPFDDDRVLSLILSKAFLLAADATITDKSITRQITEVSCPRGIPGA
jgi:hypothetical protein